jgi:hypothetical protein
MRVTYPADIQIPDGYSVRQACNGEYYVAIECQYVPAQFTAVEVLKPARMGGKTWKWLKSKHREDVVRMAYKHSVEHPEVLKRNRRIAELTGIVTYEVSQQAHTEYRFWNELLESLDSNDPDYANVQHEVTKYRAIVTHGHSVID